MARRWFELAGKYLEPAGKPEDRKLAGPNPVIVCLQTKAVLKGDNLDPCISTSLINHSFQNKAAISTTRY